MAQPLYDVVGVGANSVDTVYRLPSYPQPGGPTAKLPILEQLRSCGGQTATTLCTVASFGRGAKYVGAFGNDEAAAFIRQELERRQVDLRNAVTRSCPNPNAVILLAQGSGERVVLWQRDPKLMLQPSEVQAALLQRARVVHVDDTDIELAIHAAKIASAAGVTVTSDIDRVTPRTRDLIATVTFAIFDEHVPKALTAESDVTAAVRKLGRLYDKTLCVTLGAGGALLYDDGQLIESPGVRLEEVVDTTGAGDVFRGALIYSLLKGDTPQDMLRFANAAAAASCRRLGAIDGVPTLDEVLALMRS